MLKLRYLLIITVLYCLGSVSAYAKTILIVGDSISAAYGMNPEQGWVKLLQKKLDQHYPKQHRVINASVSGETTSGAKARLPTLLQKHKPDVIVIELGGNDGLRGQNPMIIHNNLMYLVTMSKKAKAEVILFGMKIPPNYGKAYTAQFEKNYASVAQKQNIKLLPFFLEGVAGNNNLMQNDLIHPNVKAQPILLNLAWKYIEPSLKK